jgi:hypothetical protein
VLCGINLLVLRGDVSHRNNLLFLIESSVVKITLFVTNVNVHT